ncbi:hypothetical protein ABZY09_46455 [Streptomyces sp. NPDC002928]
MAEHPVRFYSELKGTTKTLADVLDRLGFTADAEKIRRQFAPDPSEG